MTGYSLYPIIALFCYLFLFVTLLAARKSNRTINAFMSLLLIMIFWVGGSFAMRQQFWPSVILWHHVSLFGMTFLVAGYYYFTLAFLDEKFTRKQFLWVIFHGLLFIFNCFTGLFIPEPDIQYAANGSAQFVYHYTWHICIFFFCILLCLFRMIQIIYRHCRGNQIAYQHLRPIIIGLMIIVLGHVATVLPVFAGIPTDIMSGPVNCLFIFYALYKKRLFRLTVFFTKINYFLLALGIGALTALNTAVSMYQFLLESLGLGGPLTIGITAGFYVLIVLMIYTLLTLIMHAVFSRKERTRKTRIEVFTENNSHMLNVSDILQNLTDTIQELTHIERMLVFTRLPDGDFRVEHTTNPLEEKSFYLRTDHPLITHFRENASPIKLQEFSRTTIYRSMWEKEKNDLMVLGADYLVPLASEDVFAGILVLPTRKNAVPYPASTISLVHTLCSISAAAVNDAAAYERAIDDARTDKLTGLANRKYFFELLENKFEEYRDSTVALCLINLDDFKRYNHLYGVQEGDLALQRVAGILLSGLNDTGIAARIEGKEFALLLPGYDIHSAKLLTENVASEIRKINHRHSDHITYPLTISAGICAAPYMAASAQELFQNAETAVYTVKRSGKNAVQIYSSEIHHSQEVPRSKYTSGYNENAATIYALTAAIDAKDHYTFQHSENVAYYATELAKSAGMDNDLVEIVREASLLHDIGKIGIREDILNKPGKLTPAEFEIMKGHVENAVNIIRHLPSLEYVIPTVYSHHEHYDGSGYPRRLKGEEIPIVGRILCIADAFDAMISTRSYKQSLSKEEALEIIKNESGKQFDPKLVLIFLELFKQEKIEVRTQS